MDFEFLGLGFAILVLGILIIHIWPGFGRFSPSTKKSESQLAETDFPEIPPDGIRGLEFGADSSDLSEYPEDLFSAMAKYLLANPNAILIVEGYTDSTGRPARNRKLSIERAKSVCRIFQERFAIPAERMEAIGKGDAKPIGSNSTTEGRRRNRRIEARIENRKERKKV